MIFITSRLNGNLLHLDEDGCLMETYCAGGVSYNNPKYVMWDELTEDKLAYYEGRHYYLLQEVMPEKIEDFYPEYCPATPAKY